MSRIQNILEKAEREGAALRTGRMVPFETASPPPIAVGAPDPAKEPRAVSTAPPAAPAVIAPAATVTGLGAAHLEDAIEGFTANLNPLLVAALAPKSLAAEQYRSLRTRLAHAEGAGGLRTVLITSPQKGEGK